MLCGCCSELDQSQRMAHDLEDRMRHAERERLELQEAQQRAEEARRLAEEAAYLEKTEREAKVCSYLESCCIQQLLVLMSIH